MKRKLIELSVLLALCLGFYLLIRNPGHPKPAESQMAPPEKETPEEPQPPYTFDQTATLEDFSVNGAKLMDTANEVRAVLGDPVKITRSSQPNPYVDDDISYMYEETWEYPGLSLWFLKHGEKGKTPPADSGQLRMITIHSAAYKTHRGIRVGDPGAKIREAYGPGTYGAASFEWEFEHKPYRLDFMVSGDGTDPNRQYRGLAGFLAS